MAVLAWQQPQLVCTYANERQSESALAELVLEKCYISAVHLQFIMSFYLGATAFRSQSVSFSCFTNCGWQEAVCAIFIERYDLLIVSPVCAGLKIKTKKSVVCSKGAEAKI